MGISKRLNTIFCVFNLFLSLNSIVKKLTKKLKSVFKYLLKIRLFDIIYIGV